MPVSKLKNLALLVLVLANLILVLLMVPGRVAQRQQAEQMRQSLSDLYAKQQVSLDPELIPDTVTLYALELAEDASASLTAASALLGEGILIQDDSTRYLSLYEGQAGSCRIGRNGSFLAQLTGQPEISDLPQDAKRILQTMGFQWDTLEDPVRVRAGVFSIRATQAVLGVPVFSDGLTLTYANNRLTALEGEFYTGAATLTRISEQACMSAADALVQFLAARLDLGWVGSTITAMEQGYLHSETAMAATIHLTPVWHLDTDTGSFCINGITGEISPVA